MTERIDSLNDALTSLFLENAQAIGKEKHNQINEEHCNLADSLAADFSDENIEKIRSFRGGIIDAIKKNIAIATEARNLVGEEAADGLDQEQRKDINKNLYNALGTLEENCRTLVAILNNSYTRLKIADAISDKGRRGGSTTKLDQLYAELIVPAIPMSEVDIDNLYNFAQLRSRSSIPEDRFRAEAFQSNKLFTELYLLNGDLDEATAAKLQVLKEKLKKQYPPAKLDGIEMGLVNHEKRSQKRADIHATTGGAVKAALA